MREETLRHVAEYVDERDEQVSGLIKFCTLGAYYHYVHTKVYIQERCNSVVYLLYFGSLWLTKRLGGLLNSEEIRINRIRFCEVMAVIELLSLDIVLFIYLGSENPCTKFFELLSTVVIIPILLSSLSNLKVNKQSKE